MDGEAVYGKVDSMEDVACDVTLTVGAEVMMTPRGIYVDVSALPS